MFNVSKLSNETKKFIQNIPAVSKNNQEVLAMAVSKVIANELVLPSSPVENPIDFYLYTTYTGAREVISCINELVVIDINRVQELVKTFWLVRYNILFPRKKLYLTNQIASESHFFGFSSLLSPTDAVFIQVNTFTLLTLANGFAQMVSEMGVTETEVTA